MKNILENYFEIYIHVFIIFLSKTITMQCLSCCHVMALCYEDKQILYFQCKHGTCFAEGMKCKYYNVIKFSKKDTSRISNILC